MSLKDLIRYLNRPLIPYVRWLKNRLLGPSSIEPGDEGDVLTTVSGEATWAPPSGGVDSGANGEVLTTAGGVLDWALLVNANIDAAAAVAVSKLAAGTDGDVLTTVAGVATWTPPTSGSWHVYKAIDCAAAATTTFPTSLTPVTFDGVDWIPRYVSASGGDADNGDITNTNGVGLQFTCNGNASTVGSLTYPRLLLDLRELGPLYDLAQGPFRVRVRVTGSYTSDFQFFYCGFAQIAAEAQNTLGAIGYNAGDGGATTTGQITHGGGSADYFLNPEALGSNDVMELRLYNPWSLSCYFGEWAGDWPDIDFPQGTMASTQSSDTAQDAYIQQRDTTLGAGAGNRGLYLTIGVAPNAPGVGFTATVTHISIEQWRTGA